MKIWLRIMLLAVVLALASGAQRDGLGSISGTVTALGIKKPMSGVEVACYRDSLLVDIDVTKATGSYKIDKLNPGIYAMYFSSKYYEEKILRKIKVKAGKNTDLDIAIDTSITFMYFTEDNPGIGRGKLAVKVRQDNGRPVQYVNVALYQNDTRITGTQTNEKGTGQVKNIPPGTYDVKFSLIGFAAQTYKDVKIEPDRTTALNPKMKRAGI